MELGFAYFEVVIQYVSHYTTVTLPAMFVCVFCYVVSWHINLCGLSNAKAILVEEQLWYYSSLAGEMKEFGFRHFLSSMTYCYVYREYFRHKENYLPSGAPMSELQKRLVITQRSRRTYIRKKSNLKKNATETYGMLQTAFRPSCMNRASVFEWHKRFKEGRESLRGDERCVRSKEVNTPDMIGQKFRVRVSMLRF